MIDWIEIFHLLAPFLKNIKFGSKLDQSLRSPGLKLKVTWSGKFRIDSDSKLYDFLVWQNVTLFVWHHFYDEMWRHLLEIIFVTKCDVICLTKFFMKKCHVLCLASFLWPNMTLFVWLHFCEEMWRNFCDKMWR